ncbi:MAG: phage terminase large subunit family protein [Lachnospiraceae bacterium]|nr:phage terminase large subunit family protein [Lachnospiraceae bacterium]
MKRETINLFKEIFKVLEPPPDLTLSQWADKYRRLSAESGSKGGHWNTDRAPWQREIMDAITDITIEKVVVMSAAQMGKTDGFLLNTIGYYMHYDPCTILCMQPTLSLAETLSKDRLMPMVRDTPVLKDKINEKSRTSGNTILKKSFPGGRITMTGANSATELRSRPIRVLLADEIDAYPATAGTEGDPLLLAGKRLTTYWNRKEVDTSTPTIKGISRIDMEYKDSTMEEWNVPCPGCGEFQPLEWNNLIYNLDADKEVKDINYVCAKCGSIHSETEWKDNFNKGKYIAEYPKRKVRGFHFNSLASTFFGWEKIIKGYIKADEARKKGNTQLIKSWFNTELGLPWEEDGESADKDKLFKRREKYHCEVPDEVIAVTAGVDTQDDRFEVEVVGWGIEYESYGIVYKRIYGDLKQRDVWKRLDDFLLQTFKKTDGTKMRILCTCMDSGGHFANRVYKFCKQRTARKVFAIKGKGGAERPYISRPTKNNREETYLFTLGVDTGKSLLLQRLLLEEEGPGYCHFPKDEKGITRGYDKDYFKGLTAEKQVLRYNKEGRPCFVWELTEETKRNEPLDCRNYAQAAIEITGLTLKEPLKKETGTGATSKKTKKRRGNRSGGIL